jgi:hypothetical protein
VFADLNVVDLILEVLKKLRHVNLLLCAGGLSKHLPFLHQRTSVVNRCVFCSPISF